MPHFGKACMVLLIVVGMIIMGTALALEAVMETLAGVPQRVRDAMSFHPYF